MTVITLTNPCLANKRRAAIGRPYSETVYYSLLLKQCALPVIDKTSSTSSGKKLRSLKTLAIVTI